MVETVEPPISRHDPELLRPLNQFRAKTLRLKIHPAELAVLWILGTHLIFLPWAIGGMRVWSQVISAVVAAVGFIVALVPRHYTEEYTGTHEFRLVPWPRLARFPLFWIGLALLAYIAVQALNPSWLYETDGKVWWMRAIPNASWLPTSVSVPFERWGPWRKLLIYGSVWLTVCTLWTGITRRRSLQLLFIALSVNGLLLAVFGVAQRLLGNGKMFWVLDFPGALPFSSFVYKNHAGAYLNLTLVITCALAAWYYLRGLRRLEKSNPSGVFAFFATCIAVSILTSYARGATAIMLTFLLVTVGFFAIHQLLIPNENRKPIVAVVLILIFGFFLKTGLGALDTGEAWQRLKDGLTNTDRSLEFRAFATQASLEMLGDTWQRGAGAGSFTFLFPAYQHRHPNLVARNGVPMFWEHAHNDIVEIPIELGAIGMALVAAAAAFLAYRLIKSYFWTKPFSASVVFGLVLALVYAWWDFPFQNPAILMLWCTLAVGVTMWTAFEEQNAKA